MKLILGAELISIENEPILSTGMIAVYWDSAGNEIKQTDANFKRSNWYNYSKKKWANAKTEDGSYWVWIPRYAYKIESGLGTSTTGTISIKFLEGTTNKTTYGEEISTTYPTIENNAMTDYVVHPAFRNGTANDFSNGEWDEEIEGMWVAKFEAGYAMDRNGDGVSDVTGGNTVRPVASSVNYTQKTVWASPQELGGSNEGSITARNWLDGIYASSSTTWLNGQTTAIKYPVFIGKSIGMNYTNANDCYNLCKALTEEGNIYGLNNNADSHLIKNSEWGAIEYLSTSQYGNTNIYSNNVNIHTGGTSALNNFSSVYGVTGYASGTNTNTNIYTTEALSTFSLDNTITNGTVTSYAWYTTEGQKASSTGNITGIYDLAGGLCERTTSYVANGNNSLKSVGSSITYNGDTLKTASTKYTTVYPHNSTSDNTGISTDNLNSACIANYAENTDIYGDAMRETEMARSTWNGGFGTFIGLHLPFLLRGGSPSNVGGGYLFTHTKGSAVYHHGFRPVLIIE